MAADRPSTTTVAFVAMAGTASTPEATPALSSPSVPACTSATVGVVEPSGSNTHAADPASLSCTTRLKDESATSSAKGYSASKEGGEASVTVNTEMDEGAPCAFPATSSATNHTT